MPQKHLFRFALKNVPVSKETGRIRALSQEMDRADEILSRHLPVHVIQIEYEERKEHGYTEYARDAMVQHGKGVFVKPPLSEYWSNLSLTRILPYVPAVFPFARPELARKVRNAGYKGALIKHTILSEGGKFVIGDKFWFASDIYFRNEHDIAVMREFAGSVEKPVYPFYSFTSVGSAHIDCDAGIVDDVRIVYTSLDVSAAIPEKPELDDSLSLEQHAGLVNSRRTLDKIASEYGYAIRTYRRNEKHFHKNPDGSYPNMNGINFLTGDGAIFTTNIHPGEKRYLQKRGINAIEIPLAHTTPGAGFCQININKTPLT